MRVAKLKPLVTLVAILLPIVSALRIAISIEICALNDLYVATSPLVDAVFNTSALPACMVAWVSSF